MIIDAFIKIVISVFDIIIDLLPNSLFNSLIDWLDWGTYSDLISNIMYFVPIECIAFFINFCLPFIGICALIGMIRVVWDILPFT